MFVDTVCPPIVEEHPDPVHSMTRQQLLVPVVSGQLVPWVHASPLELSQASMIE